MNIQLAQKKPKTCEIGLRMSVETIDPNFARDILESDIPRDILEILLLDRTTGKNILWMSDNYVHLESVFDVKMGKSDSINTDVISRPGNKIIRPRVDKSRDEQRKRIVGKAEVFTPSWVCNAMNNLVDSAWFNRKTSPFNKEEQNSWQTEKATITFPKKLKKTWLDYVNEVRLEMCCGEAPFIASRYDTTTGNVIPVPERIGILDRKLRIINENVGCDNPSKWLEYAKSALKAVLGFEWQGDNVLLARENILWTILEYYKFYCSEKPIDHATLLELAEVVSWNIWQMDGLKFVVPESCHDEEFVPQETVVQLDMFAENLVNYQTKPLPIFKPCPGCARKNPLDGAREHNGIYCNIMDWEEKHPTPYVNLVRDTENR